MANKKSACDGNFVSFKDFMKLDIRIGTIKSVKQHPDADKLYIILLEMGRDENDRQIVAGIKPAYKEDELIGKQIAVVVNLEHKEIRGVHSQGMLLAAEDGENPVALLVTDRKINDNAKVR
ncbi:hypothetical protein KY317_02730 [Candidatus Woesearchaeota archaeon]|nr:hypothetical protein [Candidatus Woesearchaeota archaeon]